MTALSYWAIPIPTRLVPSRPLLSHSSVHDCSKHRDTDTCSLPLYLGGYSPVSKHRQSIIVCKVLSCLKWQGVLEKTAARTQMPWGLNHIPVDNAFHQQSKSLHIALESAIDIATERLICQSAGVSVSYWLRDCSYFFSAIASQVSTQSTHFTDLWELLQHAVCRLRFCLLTIRNTHSSSRSMTE